MTNSDKKHQSYLGRAKRMILAVGVVGALIVATPALAVVSVTPDKLPLFNGRVWATVYSGNTIYVGGDFTAAVVNGKQIARTRLAAIDAVTGTLLPWAPTADSRVRAIAVSGGSVYVAGEFLYVSGQKRDSLARLDAITGAVHKTFKHSILGKPYALAAAHGRLYMGGAITAVNGQPRTRLAAFNLTTGVLDTVWKPFTDDQVQSLAATADRIYVGGKFHKVNGVKGYNRLAALNPTSGAVNTGFKASAPYIVYAVVAGPNGVYAALGGQGGRAIAYSTTGAKRWTATFDGDPQALAVLGGTVYVGGHFDKTCKTERTGSLGTCLDGSIARIKLAAFDDADGTLSDWVANANGIEGVLAMAVQPTLGKFVAGGAFTLINGKSHKRLAQFG